MKGTMTIKATEHGYGIDCDFADVSRKDKFELLHSVAVALQMDDRDIAVYAFMEGAGLLKDAADVVPCGSEEDLEARLRGEGPTNES